MDKTASETAEPEPSRAPVRLLLLTTGLDRGGTERSVCRLAEALLDTGRYDVQVACVQPPGPCAENLRQLGIPVRAFSARSPWAGPRVVRDLARHLRTARVEILHTFLFHANVVGRLAVALARIRRWRGRLLSSQRTAAAPLWRRWAEHATVRAHERVVCVSEHVASFARTQLGVSEAQVVVIPNGVEVPADDRVKPAQLDGPWICTARLSRDKRHDDLIDAWRTMAADGAPPRLVLVGGGERTAELRARAAGLPIELLGERADVRKLLNEACGFVFGAAVAEGCPNAVLEAMAEGLPVVATDTPGLREIVVPEETGLLVAGGDARALAAAVRLLDDDASLRRRFGAAGRERVRERFSLAATVCAYDRLYQASHPDVANPL